MQPDIGSSNGKVPLRVDAEGNQLYPEWEETDSPPGLGPEWTQTYDGPGTGTMAVDEDTALARWREKRVAELEAMTDAELLAEAGVEPTVSTSEAAEYFDRTTQWIYWGLKPDPKTGRYPFAWPDETPIVPDRVAGQRRFSTSILRAILQSSFRRGNIAADELKNIIKRIRYTELGVEWREKEGWRYINLGRNRYRWVRPEDTYYSPKTKDFRLRKKTEEPDSADE